MAAFGSFEPAEPAATSWPPQQVLQEGCFLSVGGFGLGRTPQRSRGWAGGWAGAWVRCSLKRLDRQRTDQGCPARPGERSAEPSR